MNDEVMKVLADLQKQMAVKEEREFFLRETIDKLAEDLSDVRAEVGEIHAMANRWKGGFIVITALGGIIGWVLSTWESVTGLFSR